MNQPDFAAIGLAFASGVVLFLLGVRFLSDNLKELAGDRMRRLIGGMTTNRFFGALTGMLATFVLDSSSAVVIIVVGLVHARAMTFAQAIGVVMGANIGTTLSSQIYALDLVKYSPALLVPGLTLHWLGGSVRTRQLGGVVLGLGMIFFALTHMEEAAKPLRDHAPFHAFMTRLENPLWGVVVGAVTTAVIQSSSAMLGILIALVGQGSVSLPAAVAMMLGAELGTCLDVLIASAGRSREAVRVGVFQALFNLVTVGLAVGLTRSLTELSAAIAGDDVKRQLATAHVVFNVAGVLLFIWFTGTIAKWLTRLIPDSEPLTTSGGRGDLKPSGQAGAA